MMKLRTAAAVGVLLAMPSFAFAQNGVVSPIGAKISHGPDT